MSRRVAWATSLAVALGAALAAAQIPPAPVDPPSGQPDGVVDLATAEGVALVKGQWRYSDTKSRRGGLPRTRRGSSADRRARQDLRRDAPRRGPRLRRLGMGRHRGHQLVGAPLDRTPLLQLVPDQRDHSRACGGFRDEGLDGRVRDVHGRLRRDLGRRRAAASARAEWRLRGNGWNASNRLVIAPGRQARAEDPARRLRNQRAALESPDQLHLDAPGPARVLQGERPRAVPVGAPGGERRRRAPRSCHRRDRSAQPQDLQGRRGLPVHRGARSGSGTAATFSSATRTRTGSTSTPRKGSSPSSRRRAAMPAPTSPSTASPAPTA